MARDISASLPAGKTCLAIHRAATYALFNGIVWRADAEGSMVPTVGIELTTYRLQGGCSTTELSRRKHLFYFTTVNDALLFTPGFADAGSALPMIGESVGFAALESLVVADVSTVAGSAPTSDDTSINVGFTSG
jgi:hypothetical protein